MNNLFNFNIFKADFMLNLFSSNLSTLSKYLFASFFCYMLGCTHTRFSPAYHIFVETNEEYLTSLCKQCQEILNENQTALFFLVNLKIFFILSLFFESIQCLIIHILWLDVVYPVLHDVRYKLSYRIFCFNRIASY